MKITNPKLNMNQIIRDLALENFNNFSKSFENSKNLYVDPTSGKLRHSGEFGTYREDLVKRWLRVITPENFGIGSGFIVSPLGSISTQCDIIIYDKLRTPVLQTLDNQRFFPIESVCCVGEVKSKKELNSHLQKLSEVKKMRDGLENPIPYRRVQKNDKCPYDLDRNPFDNIFTFLICKKFNFDSAKSFIDYKNIAPRYKHNMLLSLDDGLWAYTTDAETKGIMYYPFSGQHHYEDISDLATKGSKDSNEYIINFLSFLHIAFSEITLHEIDMARYLCSHVKTIILKG